MNHAPGLAAGLEQRLTDGDFCPAQADFIHQLIRELKHPSAFQDLRTRIDKAKEDVAEMISLSPLEENLGPKTALLTLNKVLKWIEPQK